MKRIKKQAVLESITLLENANEYVTADLKQEELLNILTQCQEAAILTGNDLETQGESTKELVTMLEEYCELIFQISQSMDDPENRRQLAQTVRNLLIRLHSKTVELLPEDRKEIVFLPYKASMWDSLESVWKAADADPECDAYVIPIPYYDKNPDGSFREMHYEGDLFPDDVPITRYDAYSLEERRPDAIYIHNPYDEANYVTSVYPMYYSQLLKNNTCCLIYIPYFVAGYYSSTESAIRNIPYCINNVDYVIVQSNLQKQLFGINKDYYEKLIVMGNPKIDKVINEMNKESNETRWDKFLKGKKVILLNSSITKILNENEWGKKIEQILNIIENNPHLALIWRPHPLLKATIEAMVPQKKKEYLNVFDHVSRMENALIDYNSSPNEAIKYADAMISDYSSLVMQFTVTGKPVLVLNGSSEFRKTKKVCFDYFSNYFYEDGVGVTEFIKVIENEEDTKRDERIKYMKKTVVNMDGTCGQRIHEFVVARLAERGTWNR